MSLNLRRNLRRVVLRTVIALSVAHPAAALTIALNGSGTTYLETRAYSGTGSNNLEYLYPTTTPYLATSTSIDGGASSESEYDLSDTGITITLTQSRDTTGGALADSLGQIRFSVDEDTGYVISGYYNHYDDNVGHTTGMLTELYDVTGAPVMLFGNTQLSYATPFENLVLGQTGGDNMNSLAGSLTGILTAGTEYRLDFYTFMATDALLTPNSANVSGEISLLFAPVPEPHTGMLLIWGLVGMARFGRRHR